MIGGSFLSPNPEFSLPPSFFEGLLVPDFLNLAGALGGVEGGLHYYMIKKYIY